MDQQPAQPFVSRAGLKLAHALDAFKLDVSGFVCADFGCNVGGFTDCLLQHGAARVFAIDTGYGTLHYRLRTDPRVVVMERTNALHAAKPQAAVDLVVIDLAWTPQRFSIPAAAGWIKQPDGRIVSLIKPHYEVEGDEKNLLVNGALSPENAQRVFERLLNQFSAMGVDVLAHAQSPLTGGKSGRKKHGSGNVEFFVLVQPKSA